MAVNKRLAKKREKMAAKKEAKAVVKAVKEVKEIPIIPLVEVAPVVEETPVVEKKTTRKKAAKKVEEVKVEEVAEKPEKKPAARKPRKKAVKVSFVVQAAGKEITNEEAIEKAKEAWVAEGNKASDLKELTVYIKPEDQAIYYVANGEVTGKVAY